MNMSYEDEIRNLSPNEFLERVQNIFNIYFSESMETLPSMNPDEFEEAMEEFGATEYSKLWHILDDSFRHHNGKYKLEYKLKLLISRLSKLKNKDKPSNSWKDLPGVYKKDLMEILKRSPISDKERGGFAKFFKLLITKQFPENAMFPTSDIIDVLESDKNDLAYNVASLQKYNHF